MLSQLLRVKDVAALLDISECTIFRMVERKEIPHIRIGRNIRFRLEGIEEYLCMREFSAESEQARESIILRRRSISSVRRRP